MLLQAGKKIWVFFSAHPSLPLIGVIIIFFFAYDYQDILFLRPQSHHAWRQADCLSFTLNYYRENVNFFQPILHHCDSNGSVKGITEFPILYFLIAQLWKLFGYHEFIYRLVVMLIFFSSLFALQRMCMLWFKSIFWSTWLASFTFTSCILVYYANNFLTDVPALSFALWGWYFLTQFYFSGSKKRFVVSIAFFTLAALLKISSAISLVPVLLYFLLEAVGLFKKDKDKIIFKDVAFYFFSFLLFVLPVTAWYFYANWYSDTHRCAVFLIGILPIWNMNPANILSTASDLFIKVDHELFNLGGLYISTFLFGLVILFKKQIPVFLFFVTFSMVILFLAYLLLFFQVFNVHDYYLVNMYIVFIFIFMSGMAMLHSIKPVIANSVFLKSLAFIYLGWCTFECAIKVKWRYFDDRISFDEKTLLNKNELDFYAWYHDYYREKASAFETIEPYNRSLGIKREDLVISYGDASPNYMLYLMDQKGFSDFGEETSSAERVRNCISNGAKYLFVTDTASVDHIDYMKPFLAKPFGHYKSIFIYDLRKVH